MTKALKTLIKMNKHFLDEKRRELVILEEGREQLFNFIKKLDVDLEMERNFATKSVDKSYTFLQFLQNLRTKQEEAKKKVYALDLQIKELSQQIHEVYSEMKKFDIMKGIKERKAAKEEADKNQAMLDEMGGVAFQRKKK